MQAKVIKIGKSCNSNCIFCSVTGVEFETDTDKIITDIKNAKGNSDQLIITGQEPSIHPDIVKIVETARDLNYSTIQLVTNGRALFYPKIARDLIVAGVTEILIPILGHTADIHDRITQVKGSFKQTITGIKNINHLSKRQKYYRDVTITAGIVITNANCRNLEDIVHLLSKLNINQVYFIYPRQIGNALKFKDEFPNLDKTKTLVQMAIDYASKKGMLAFTKNIDLEFLGKYAKFSSEIYDQQPSTISVPNSNLEKVPNLQELQGLQQEHIDSILADRSKVALQKAESYDLVKASIKKALDDLGGIETFVREGDRVLLKPNLIYPLAPEKAATTNDQFVKAVIEIVQEVTPHIIVADCSVGTDPQSTLDCAKASGVLKVCEDTGVTFKNIHEEGFYPSDIPVHDKLERTDFTNLLKQVDIVINLPKLKTHGIAFFTGALKNCFGLIHPSERVYLHGNFQKPEQFCAALVDIFSYTKPQLNIMDAVTIMEGDEGPAYGDPVNLGGVLVSTDAVALDAVATTLIGYEPLAMPMIANAHERHLGQGTLERIDVVGSKIEDLQKVKIDKNSLFDYINTQKKELGYGTEFTFEPIVDESKCDKHGVCVKKCPVGAIKLDPFPVIDMEKCIKCFRCKAVCPKKAMGVTRKTLPLLQEPQHVV